MCIQEPTSSQAGCFLFINKKSGYAGDLVLPDNEIPCIAPSPTGQSVICCSQIVRANRNQLKLFECIKKGDISADVARKLEDFVKSVPTLTAEDRRLILSALSQIK